MSRLYYSARTGKNPIAVRLDLATLKRLFLAAYRDFVARDYFQEFYGKDCVDDREPPVGTAGYDVEAFFLRKLRKDGLWPIPERIDGYSEDDLFDVVELLHDHVSVGVEGWAHSFSGCGMHYSTFDRETGRREFRNAVNEFLPDYGGGYELTDGGEIVRALEAGFEPLATAPLPHADGPNVRARIDAAVAKYRRRSSTLGERRDAVRDLVDVLEYLRPQVKQVLAKKDESDLFEIANNFAIRHHNPKQRTDYDPNIWTSWMFYFYLATVHAVLRLIQRQHGG